MLYSLGSLGFYCFFGGNYQTNKTFPLVVNIFCWIEWKETFNQNLYSHLLGFSCNNGDCCFLAVRKCCLDIWSLCCEIYVSDPDSCIKTVCMKNADCTSVFAGNFAGLNISIVRWNEISKKVKPNYCIYSRLQIFGFLNFFLWTVNLWFQQDAAAAGAGGQSPI